MMTENPFISIGKRVLLAESDALKDQANCLTEEFAHACKLILECHGRVVVTGMGKSGHIAHKIAASLTSTGIAAYYLHPAEGVHGDLGIIHRNDLLLAISLSGETQEILDLLGPITHLHIPVIAITGSADSNLALSADAVLLLSTTREADTHDLVPSTSTTLSLAIGDALVIALMEYRGFSPQDFAVFHPSGMLGKRLTLAVRELLAGPSTNPVVSLDDTLGTAIETISRYKLGGTSVVDASNRLAGILTDGDVRRLTLKFAAAGKTVAEELRTQVHEVMTQDPSYIHMDSLAYDAMQLMENHKPSPISVLPVVDDADIPVGMIHLHDLVRVGFKSRNSRV
jgi:arabinose-5-phosphate isomerase